MKAYTPRVLGEVLVVVAFLAATLSLHVTAQTPLTPAFDCGTVSQIPTSECQALVALYNGTNGPGWTNSTGWLANNTPCTWNGISCTEGHITGISLFNNQLSGAIPAELGNLPKLKFLNVWRNQLTGSIPSQLGSLTDLTQLQLWNNQLSGPIPHQLGNLTNLQVLDLAYNNGLDGSIPRELGKLTNLMDLRLQSNRLSGPVPSEIGNLTKLRQLWLLNNQLGRQSLPQSLTNLTALDYFYFDTGLLCLPANTAFQAWFAAIPNRQPGATSCTDCSAVTSIPPAECQALVAFFDGTNGPSWTDANNWLWGTDPCYWQGVSCDSGRVTRLELSNNNLSGRVPSELGALTGLFDLYLDSNQLKGKLPQSMTNLYRLSSFYYDTALLCLPDNTAFQAWYAGIQYKPAGGAICKGCYLPVVSR